MNAEAVGIRESVSFHMAHGQFDASGRLLDPGPADTAAAALLRQLAWWARALRTARTAQTYPA